MPNLDLHLVLQDMLIVTSAAIVCALLCSLIRLPTIIGFIGAGMLVGPYGLEFVSSIPGAEAMVEIGIVLLLFSIGIECSTDMIKHYRKSFFIMGGLQVLLTTAFCGLLLPFPLTKSIFIGFLVSLSSTAIIIKHLQDSREHASPHGTCVTGILLFQDFAVIGMTIAIPFLAEGQTPVSGISFLSVLTWIGGVCVAGLLLYIARRYLIPILLENIVQTRSRELFILAIFVLCFGVAVAIESAGLSLGIGAFVAGLLISGSAFGLRTTAEILPLKDTVLGLFFASVGTLINLSFVREHVFQIVGLVLLIFLIKVFLVAIIGFVSKVPEKTSLIAGVFLFQMGEFSFVLGEMGESFNIISAEEFQYILALAAITMMLTPLAIRFLPPLIINIRSKRSSEVGSSSDKADEKVSYHDQTFIIGYGLAGQALAKELKARGLKFSILEQNYSLIKQAQKKGYDAHFCDATNLDELIHLGIEKANLAVICVSGISATRIIAERLKSIVSRNTKILARVQFARQASELAKVLPSQDVIDAESVSADVLIAKTFESLPSA